MSFSNTLFASLFPGANAGEKIRFALSALSPAGGIIDCTGFVGDQTISTDIFQGITAPGELRLGQNTFYVTVPIQVPSNWTIYGLGDTSILRANGELPLLVGAGRSASAILYVKPNQKEVTIRDLYVRGHYTSGAAGNTSGIYLGLATMHCQVLNCRVSNCSKSGITLWNNMDHLIESNHTESNAWHGIESWSSETRIIDNHSHRDAIAGDALAAIEIINGSGRTIVDSNLIVQSQKAGMELNIGPTSNVRITNNTIAGSRYGGIIGGQGWSQLTVAANVIEGVGGDGMVFMDCQRFRIVDNQISGAIHGVGLHIDGSSNNGFVSGNIVAGNAIGIGVTGTSGTSGAILLMGNFSFDNADNHDVEISPSGDKVHTVMNVFGSEFHWEL